jgi:hypothetical protein
VAELLHLAVSDAELQAELRRRAEGRLDAFALARSERDLRDAVEAAGTAV